MEVIFTLLMMTMSAYGFSANDTDPSLRAKSVSSCGDDEYRQNNKCCKKCPAGSRVLRHCSENQGSAYCKRCTAGKDFTEFPNGLEFCLPCQTCREDEVKREECSPMKNTVCECQLGTYLCAANMNCTNVGRCSNCSSCPVGKVITHQCNATADTVCQDPVLAGSPVTSQTDILILVLCSGGGVIIISLLVVVGFFFWRKRSTDQGFLEALKRGLCWRRSSEGEEKRTQPTDEERQKQKESLQSEFNKDEGNRTERTDPSGEDPEDEQSQSLTRGSTGSTYPLLGEIYAQGSGSSA